MAHFAKINNDNEVLTVLAVDNSNANTEAEGQAYLETHNNWPANKWIQCSYNTRANVHLLGGTPFRANYPGIGWKWDSINSIFHLPQPYASWTLNNTTGLWEPPIPMPNTTSTNSDGSTVDDSYEWNETDQEWIKNTVTF
jgi:hypothetical protein